MAAKEEQSQQKAEEAVVKAFDKPADPKPAKKGVAKYIGQASTRRISVKDWSSIGIAAESDTIWHFGNSFQIPLDQLSSDQVEYLRRDGLFSVGG